MIEFFKNNWFEIFLLLLVTLLFKKNIKTFFNSKIKIFYNKIKIIYCKIIDNLPILVAQLIKALARFELKLKRHQTLKNNLNLEDLTANLAEIDKGDQLKTYIESLKYAIENANIINVALTGGYGSGKSTVINEFVRQNRAYEYLHISLANFNGENNDEKLIETSIVQQILYFEKKKRLKESSFHRIDFTRPSSKFLLSSLITFWIYSLVYLFFDEINKKIIIFSNGYSFTNVFFQTTFIAGILLIIYKSYNSIKNIKFSKLTQDSLEIVNEKTDKDLSIFNRNIEEIIYFFEKTNTDIVIIEDVDRFSEDIAIKLFSKIRELSILIKQAKDIKQTVKFIYSVKDELILTEKTKFFDFIIPIIPVIDYNNSKNKFFNKLKTEIENGLLDKNFISEVSNYIYDMRTVINICNEFKLYFNILRTNKTTDLDCDRLFSIILYKNLFSDDFALIQKNCSKLHLIFNKKDLLTELESSRLEKIEGKKIEKNELQSNINNLIIKDINELRKIYIFQVYIMLKELNSYNINKIEESKFDADIISDINFEKIKNSNNILYDNEYGNNKKSNLTFKSVETKVDNKFSYHVREQLIRDFHHEKIIFIENEIIKLQNEISLFQNSSLYDLYINFKNETETFISNVYTNKVLKKVNNVEFMQDFELPNLDLIKYLIKNNYLNEDFIEYVSNFHEGSLSSNDNNLKIKIIQNSITDFDEKIDNVENLINEITDIRFKNDSVLNYKILDYLLLNNQTKNNEKLKFIIEKLSNNNEKTILFFRGFIERLHKPLNIDLCNGFYKEITKWDGFFELVYDNFIYELKRRVLFDLIILFPKKLDIDVFIRQNKGNKLTEMINNDSSFCIDIFDKIGIDDILKLGEKLQVKFVSFRYDVKIKNLFIKIYEVGYFEFNIDNIKLITQVDDKYIFNQDLFFKSNYGFVSSEKDSYLYKLINNRINEYIENVYLVMETNIEETSDNVSILLNNKNIKLESKLQIANKEFEGKLKVFGENFEKEIDDILLEKNKVFASWNNIIEYYGFDSEFGLYLANFINYDDNYKNLKINDLIIDKAELLDKDENFIKFIYDLINCAELSKDSFESIFEFSKGIILESEKVKYMERVPYLIKQKIIVFNATEYQYLKINHEDFLVQLLENNEIEFLENISDFQIDLSLIRKLLKSNFSIKGIFQLINNAESTILGESDEGFLLDLTTFFVNNKIDSYSFDLYYFILESNIPDILKIKLFNVDFPTHSDNTDTTKSLETLDGKFLKILNKEEVEFPDMEPYIEFLNNLKTKKYIRRTYPIKNQMLRVYYD